MTRRMKVVFLRNMDACSASSYYGRGMSQMDVDLTVIDFHHHDPQPYRRFPPADLLLMVDCGLPVEFPGLEAFQGAKHFVSIDSCHKLEMHKAYQKKYHWDFFWVAQKHVVSEFGEKAAWLPLAADETVHVFRPEMARRDSFWERLNKKNFYDISMCGAPYPHRRAFEALFRKAGLSTNFYYRKKFGDAVTRELARSTIGFNVGAGYRGTKGKDINMRVFETMANGLAMLLTNVYEGLGYEDLFEDGVHYATFTSEEEAVEKACFYARHPLEASRIAREAQRYVLAHHCYRHRCQTIIDSI